MTSSAKSTANRLNAALSTGPRTRAGKARVAGNAAKHGLAVPIAFISGYRPRIEDLTKILAGDHADSFRLEMARNVAEAQLDLHRVRLAKLALLGAIFARSSLPISTTAWMVDKDDSGDIRVMIEKIERLDRYERRARSRRKKAIMELDST